jgi:hypothetical protein
MARLSRKDALLRERFGRLADLMLEADEPPRRMRGRDAPPPPPAPPPAKSGWKRKRHDIRRGDYLIAEDMAAGVRVVGKLRVEDRKLAAAMMWRTGRFTQGEIAELLGVDLRTVSGYVADTRGLKLAPTGRRLGGPKGGAYR